MDQENTHNKADSLARDVLTLSRNTLLVNLRFLDVALSHFTLRASSGAALATDGQTLFYDPVSVLQDYRSEFTSPARRYLHLVLHCILRHVFFRAKEPDVWDIACDIAVENAISELGLRAVSVECEKKQRELCEKLKKQIGTQTAEKLYRCLMQTPELLEQARELRGLFLADEHTLWRAQTPPAGAAEFWRDAAERMQVDMETFSRRQGERADALMQNLREANREAHDYVGLLQKLATHRDALKTDPDEFDYIFYTYGLQMYDNMPLVEPLEYKSATRMREFVLAVDLTGLITAEQARRFLRRTFAALKATESFSSRILLHILTCRGEARPEPVTIADDEALERYLSGLRIREAEGTDFRPAFLWTEDALSRRELRSLKGLIYFTDALGPFPAKKPGFEQIFVFVNDNYSSPDVPPWAVRMVLQKDELNDREQQQ